MRKTFYTLSSILLLSLLACSVGLAAEEAHRSWLSPISKILPDDIVPEPERWHQPDLIPNAYFIVLVIALLFIISTRKLKRLPEGKGQTLLELFVGGLTNFFGGILGEHGKKYVPFVGSFFIFILFLNYLGLIPGFQSPTADLNTTLALGISAVIGVHIIAIKENGLIGYLKHFIGDPPWLGPLMFPLHIMVRSHAPVLWQFDCSEISSVRNRLLLT